MNQSEVSALRTEFSAMYGCSLLHDYLGPLLFRLTPERSQNTVLLASTQADI